MANFEDQLAELEKVVEQLERGDLNLEESVALFERGVQLSEACKDQLAGAESRIQVLLNPRERGPVRVEEFVLEPAQDGNELAESQQNVEEEIDRKLDEA